MIKHSLFLVFISLFISCSPVLRKKNIPKFDKEIEVKELKDYPKNFEEGEQKNKANSKSYYISNKKDIRVSIINGVKSFRFNLKGSFVLNSKTILNSGSYSVSKYGKLIRLYKGRNRINTLSSIELYPVNETSSFTIKSKRVGKGSHWSSRKSISFSGELIIKNRKSLIAVNSISIEEYLKGVVPSEMPAKSPIEALKAQAVLARTNAYRAIIDRENSDYDILSSVYDQAYYGNNKRTEKTDRAVELTKNIILTYNNEPITAFFHAVSGGRTNYSKDVWKGIDLDYIEPVWTTKTTPSLNLSLEDEFRLYIDTKFPSYFDLKSYNSDQSLEYLFKYYRWNLKSSSSEISKNIKRKFRKNLGRVENIFVKSRNRSGKVTKLEIVGTKGLLVLDNELEIRKSLSKNSLYSSNFYVIKRGEIFTFYGSGHGHGAGMCQASAIGLGLEGGSSDKILKFFYPKAQISRVRIIDS